MDLEELLKTKREEEISVNEQYRNASLALEQAVKNKDDGIIERASVNRASRKLTDLHRVTASLEALETIVQINNRGYLQLYLPEDNLSIRYTWGAYSEEDRLNSIFNPATVDKST